MRYQMALTKDAVSTCYTMPNIFAKGRIKEDVLKEVLKDFDAADTLDQMDLVSIIFLMTNENTNFYSVLNSLKKEPATLFLDLTKLDNWAEKFLEALVIIGNFKIIGKLGYTEFEIQSMKEMFVHNVHNVSVNLNKVIKSLYFLCKNLRSTEAKKLIDKVNGQLSIEVDLPWLELHILLWLHYSYITITPDKPDLSNLLKELKQIGCLINFSQSFNFESWELYNNKQNISSTDSKTLPNGALLQLSHSNSPNRSVLNCSPLWPDGHKKLCIIINEVKFNENKYEERLGSDKDAADLESTFRGCGFEVKLYKNHRKKDMIRLLDNLDDSKLLYQNYHSIIICILSHGFKGEVVFSDTETIEIEEIEKKLCCENLRDAFKLIILQTCQGKKIGVVDKKLVSDGPTMNTGDPTYHQYFGLFQATINDFAALRHIKDGSWFIQEICNVLREETPMALNEWVISVTERVRYRKGHMDNNSCKNKDVVQVPSYKGTWSRAYSSYCFSKYRQLDET